MSREQRARSSAGQAAQAPDESAREELERRMDDARESIAQTVSEIKETVTDKYQSVKEGIEDALDWREQFRSNPVPWSLGALAVGYVLGNSIAAALKGAGKEDRLIPQIAALADRFADELSEQGMKILTPVLSGAVLVPVLFDKVGELSGVDLSGLAARLAGQDGGRGKTSARGGKKKKGGKKKGKKGKKAKRDEPA